VHAISQKRETGNVRTINKRKEKKWWKGDVASCASLLLGNCKRYKTALELYQIVKIVSTDIGSATFCP
jgi:hypothetical protein